MLLVALFLIFFLHFFLLFSSFFLLLCCLLFLRCQSDSWFYGCFCCFCFIISLLFFFFFLYLYLNVIFFFVFTAAVASVRFLLFYVFFLQYFLYRDLLHLVLMSSLVNGLCLQIQAFYLIKKNQTLGKVLLLERLERLEILKAMLVSPKNGSLQFLFLSYFSTFS